MVWRDARDEEEDEEEDTGGRGDVMFERLGFVL